MIEVKNLTKRYGSTVAVSDLSFSVQPGQVYGFLGPNGAGKSTTMNIITGCLAATEGQVLINGHDIFEEPIQAKRCIGYLPEIPPLYTDMTPKEYLTFVGRAKGIGKAELKSAIAEAAETAGISLVMGKLIKNLSKGYRQRVGIAQAILGNPEIIILDEPTVGLDPKQIIEIRRLIKDLGQAHTVILSSHILSEVSAICDEILIISKGRLVANDSTQSLTRLLAPDSIVEVQAKGAADRIAEVLSEVEGAAKAVITSADTTGIVTAEVTAQGEKDIREAIFYAMKEAECPLINMSVKEASLEEVFLKLTSDNIPEDLKEKLKQAKGSLASEDSQNEKREENTDESGIS